MLRLLSVGILPLLAVVELCAGPTEDAIVAVMRLGDAPNYSWIATVEDDARTYKIVGQTIRDGFTRVKMPVVNSVRRRLGPSALDSEVEAIFRGNVSCVLATEEGWFEPDELPSHLSANRGNRPNVAFVRSAAAMKHSSIRSRSVRSRRGPAPPYSNLQLAIGHPHEELAVIVGTHTEFHVDGDVVTGALNQVGAELLLVRDGQDHVTPLAAAGRFTIWLRDGAVTRYQVKLEGVLEIALPYGPSHVAVRQSVDTRIDDVGSTAFHVPAEARQKLLD